MALAPHPNPKAGVFETMLVTGGQPVELDAHLARLASSLIALFDEKLPAEARALACKRAREFDLGRLRLAVAPGDSEGLLAEAVAAAVDPAIVFPSWERAVELRSVVVEGGLGEHKWVDRTLLEDAGGDVETGMAALLLDGDGTILEASRASVFAVRKGVLLTSPTDGRILPGIARGRAIEICRAEDIDVREVELRLDDLLGADEVFLTGSVRGVEPVRSIDGRALPPPSGTTGRYIASGLRRRWLG
jgi:para-aminobenzoate synthetase / 4-amino-4-deoxychorismate lyase